METEEKNTAVNDTDLEGSEQPEPDEAQSPPVEETTGTRSDSDTEDTTSQTESTLAAEKSTHRVEVIRIREIKDHPNADKLGIVDVWGYSVCVQLESWRVGDLAAYIPPDSMVPDTPEFEWLGEHKRIRVKKLRGILSFGFLTPAPEGAKEGDDVAEQLGITHYEPPVDSTYRTSGSRAKAPPGVYPRYDIDAFQRYSHLFIPGEMVHVTEKIHGSQIRMCFRDGEFFVGSRNEWKKEDSQCLYWRTFRSSNMLAPFLKKNPDITLYGEVVPCQKVGGEWFDYGRLPNKPMAFIFDASVGGRFMNAIEAREYCGGIPWVPVVAKEIKFDVNMITTLCSGPSLTAGTHIREGIVIKPIKERFHPKIGRVILKLVSPEYLQK